MLFTLDIVRSHSGEIKDREIRRKGSRVRIANIELESPLVFEYVDDGGIVVTSPVEAHTSNWRTKKHLTVQTENSVYSFKDGEDE